MLDDDDIYAEYNELLENDHLHKSHRERMRQKLIRFGPESFHDHELLEILLYYCFQRIDTNNLAHSLLNEYGTLWHIFSAGAHNVASKKGMGENSAVLIALVGEFIKRCNLERAFCGRRLDTIEKMVDFASALVKFEETERYYIISLDAKHQVINYNLISEGVVNEAYVYMRKVLETVALNKASHIIITHNHPSGSPTPSQNDVISTSNVVSVLNSIGVDVVDHIIISKSSFFSFMRKGLIINSIEKHENT